MNPNIPNTENEPSVRSKTTSQDILLSQESIYEQIGLILNQLP